MNRKTVAPLLVLAGAAGMILAGCGKKCETKKYSGDVTCAEEGSQVEGTGASGAFQYIGADYDERTEILGKLEKYAVDHTITGLPLYENSAFVMYQDRITKGTNTYIPGYGFSILRDGELTADLPGETVDAYKRYYHQYESNDPGKINYLNADDNQVSNLFGNIATGYFGSKMNADKSGYDWYGVLSKDDKPRPVVDGVCKSIEDTTPGELHDTWRIHVRTGAEGGVKYHTSSKIENRKAFDGTYVQLEDYLTPFKVMLTKKTGWYRGAELAGQTGKYGFVGAAEFYNKTANGFSEEEWAKVGIKSGTDAEGDYLEFKLLAPSNRFYAMYGLASSLYEPIPKAFFDLTQTADGDEYGAWSKDLSRSPVDNILSIGPYVLDTWETDTLITFKKVDDWFECVENPNLYRIAGIHDAILSAAATDRTAAFQEFMAGKLDSCSLPESKLDEYRNDPRTTSVPGDSVFKLNINSTTKDQWVSLFGEEGTIDQTSKKNYWNVKPWMSNTNFLKGLFFSIDRKTLADLQGATGKIDYFSDDYLSNPEEGISYNTTDEHKAALAGFWGDTVDTLGYSAEASQAYFADAIEELYACGAINNCTKLSIDIWWMYEYQIKQEGAPIAQYIEKAFNAAAKGLGYKEMKLKVNNHAVTTWIDVYYEHLMVGQFDLGFGSISGNPLDPLNFLEVLKSNNDSGFTLNWGPDTSFVDGGEDKLEYDGKLWSFDTLYDAADRGVVLKDGKAAELGVAGLLKEGGVVYSEGGLVVTGTVTTIDKLMPDLDWSKVKITVNDVYVYDGANGSKLWVAVSDDMGTMTVDPETGVITATLFVDPLSLKALLGLGYFVFEADVTLEIDGFKAPNSIYLYEECLAPELTEEQLAEVDDLAELYEMAHEAKALLAQAKAIVEDTEHPITPASAEAINTAANALSALLEGEEMPEKEAFAAAIKALQDAIANAEDAEVPETDPIRLGNVLTVDIFA